MCKLKKVARKNACPIPRIDQFLGHLHGAKLFSNLDLASGYRQVPLPESAIPKTAFFTPDGGHHKFLRLPFGRCNVPGTFQLLMTAIFNEHLFSFFLIFPDDLLVFSKSKENTKNISELLLKLYEKQTWNLSQKSANSTKTQLRSWGKNQCRRNFIRRGKH